MPMSAPLSSSLRTPWSGGLSLAVWAVTWGLMLALDERMDLGNLALLLVLGAAVAAIGSPRWLALLACAVSVLGFNYAFVPPRGTLTVGLHQHAVLLLTMLAVSGIVTLLMGRLRWHAAQAAEHARRSDRLRQFGEALRAIDDPTDQARTLMAALQAEWPAHPASPGDDGRPPAVLLRDARGTEQWTGDVTGDDSDGLRLCLELGRALGPGTGRYEERQAWYLPLRGRQSTHGAALVPRLSGPAGADGVLPQLQALCDLLGGVRERQLALDAAQAAREQAADHALRNTLLTAIAHDHRTPLATILGAASALHDQVGRLSADQQQRLAATIADEAGQLARLTDNTLQLARLGSPGIALQTDWVTVEDLVGPVLSRARRRDPQHRIQARLDTDLPLLRVDAVLVVQLLDNLLDNARQHAGRDVPVELLARRDGHVVCLEVQDRGPGVPPALQDRLFERFQRADTAAESADGSGRSGAGLGLALCRAIAQAHGGDIGWQARTGGGSRFVVRLPTQEAPAQPPADAPEAA